MTKRVLLVVTTADKMNDNEPKGLWLSEFGEAYIAFNNEGYEVTIASPLGGQAPIDHRSLEGASQEMLDTANYLTATPNWTINIQADANLITGQNPQSTEQAANEERPAKSPVFFALSLHLYSNMRERFEIE
ncbi:hypothetical protein [Paenibacillus lignilyticus]|uniref:Type 1 glutamine amidotransferase domain-containing protein n=1 Tax=Paenibacillus lignilyticus TaxID=1172615 RepID=A0ABS5CBK6_9BACL|nr:hypothetical protein [Paenibacillus lignilyticus]MBP3963319.1 hypothetical protein [Paenibacillus lignilyticus]